MFKRLVFALIIGVLLITLPSCGGGGGGKGGGSMVPAPDPAVLPITSANAQDITESVLEAVTSSVEIIDILDILGIPVVGSTVPDGAEMLLAGIITEVIPCDSGQITVTWDDVDDNFAISTGDTFDILFETCFFADSGTTLSGTATLTNIVVTGDPKNLVAPWSLAATFGFDNLSGTDNDGTSVINGSLNFDANSDNNLLVNLSVSTAQLSVQEGSETETLSEYLLTQTIDLNTLMQVISADGTFSSTVLEGNVTFETLADFVLFGDDNPSSGQMLISDASSSVLVTVIDNISVQLDIDEDLNGSIDATIVVTWAALDID